MSLKTIFHSILDFISGGFKPALKFAYNLVNMIKNNEGTIEVLVAATSTKLDDALLPVFEKWLSKILVDLRFATIEADKSLDELLKDAIAYLDTLVGDARAAQLNTLAALIAKWYSDHTGKEMSIQDALTAMQTVYHKEGNI